MNLPDLRAELEADRAWREAEIRALQNHLSNLPEEVQSRQRRALALLLYAHYEGFCKFAFTLYVNAVNSEQLPISAVNYALAAASLTTVLEALTDNQKKSPLFRSTLPDDAGLHRFARQREFLQKLPLIMAQPVQIPNELVDFDSNLKPAVMRKILYQIGFAHDQFGFIEPEIQQLLKVRNEIAHGSLRDGVNPKTYSRLRTCAFKVMAGVLTQVSQALINNAFQRTAAIALPPPTVT